MPPLKTKRRALKQSAHSLASAPMRNFGTQFPINARAYCGNFLLKKYAPLTAYKKRAATRAKLQRARITNIRPT
ncbi:MAG: hypothetical protein DBX55_00260 [Verrucomicrobia bacterium]|nr:MAG: hypothetical protein DBX55_00260 [Verrucomicrobiota bacterium]